jgi:hypothetical protein
MFAPHAITEHAKKAKLSADFAQVLISRPCKGPRAGRNRLTECAKFYATRKVFTGSVCVYIHAEDPRDRAPSNCSDQFAWAVVAMGDKAAGTDVVRSIERTFTARPNTRCY